MKQKSAYFTKGRIDSKITTEIENRVATKFNKKVRSVIKWKFQKLI